MDVIDEENGRTMRSLDESGDDIEVGKGMASVENSQNQDIKQDASKTKRPAPLEILKQVKLNSDFVSPRSMIKGFLNMPNQADLEYSKEKLIKAEEQLRVAFVEFYQKLRLLKNYWYGTDNMYLRFPTFSLLCFFVFPFFGHAYLPSFL